MKKSKADRRHEGWHPDLMLYVIDKTYLTSSRNKHYEDLRFDKVSVGCMFISVLSEGNMNPRYNSYSGTQTEGHFQVPWIR